MAAKNINYGNRGKGFELDLNITNTIYKNKKWAFVEKTEPNFKSLPAHQLPVKFRKGHYRIGYYEEKGFVDYFGVCQGRALAFEAKSTNTTTRFPLKNVSHKQMEDLEYWHDLGGISFFLIQFEKQGEVYLMMFDQMNKWWEDAKTGGRKSIPYEWIKFYCHEVKSSRGVIWDYLKGLGIQ